MSESGEVDSQLPFDFDDQIANIQTKHIQMTLTRIMFITGRKASNK